MKVNITILDDEGKTFVGSAELRPRSGPASKLAESRKRRKSEAQETDSRPGLPGQILSLRDKGCFAEPKVALEVQAELQPTYHCELNRVRMALLRLQRGKELRKTSRTVDGRAQVAYVW